MGTAVFSGANNPLPPGPTPPSLFPHIEFYRKGIKSTIILGSAKVLKLAIRLWGYERLHAAHLDPRIQGSPSALIPFYFPESGVLLRAFSKSTAKAKQKQTQKKNRSQPAVFQSRHNLLPPVQFPPQPGSPFFSFKVQVSFPVLLIYGGLWR